MRIAVLMLLLQILFALPARAQEVSFQTGHTHDILELEFSPDDSQLLSYSAGDGWLCLWEIKSGRLLWKTRTGFIRKGEEHSNLSEFYWSEDGKSVVTKSRNGTYQVWDARTGKILSLTEAQPEIKLRSPERKYVSVTKDYSKIIVAAGDEKEKKEFQRFGNNSAFDTSNDGTMIAEGGSWGDTSIRITNVMTGESWWLDGHPSVVKTIAYSPDGKYLAVAGSDKNIYIFDAMKRSLWKILTGHTRPVSSVAFSPDGKILISSAEYELMKVWDWRESKVLRDIKAEAYFSWPRTISFSPDGKFFLTTTEREEFSLWDARALKLVRNFKTAERYKTTAGLMTSDQDGVPVLTAQFIDGGKRVLSSHEDGTLRFWATATGKQLRKLKVGKAQLVCVSPDSKRILAAIEKSEEDDELQIKLLDARDGKVITTFDDEETSYVETLSLSADGKRFATSSVSGSVFLWGVNQRKPLRELDIGFSGRDAIAFSPDGKSFFIGGRNQNLFLFDATTGDKLWQLIPSYEESELEARLIKESKERWAKLNELKSQRNEQAAIETAVLKKHVYITFDRYGDMKDPGEQRLAETGEPNQSRVKKSAEDANAVWLRLHNDSPLPIMVPTLSMYLDRKCFFEFPSGQKIYGLCPDREISVWFGVEDKGGKPLPYGFDFGSAAILLPKQSVLFAVPRNVLRNGNAIQFSFTFKKEAGDKSMEVKDYGERISLKFSEADLPEGKGKKE